MSKWTAAHRPDPWETMAHLEQVCATLHGDMRKGFELAMGEVGDALGFGDQYKRTETENDSKECPSKT